MVRLSNEQPRDIIAAREKRVADAAAAKLEQERLAAEKLAAEQAAQSSTSDVWGTPPNCTDETPI